MTLASPRMVDPIEMSSTERLAGLAELYERHYEAVFRAELRVTRRPVDAEDVLQTVFLRVLSQTEWDQRRAMSEDRLERALHEITQEHVDAATLEATRLRVWDTIYVYVGSRRGDADS